MINGEAARVINESGAGYACASGDGEALAVITRKMAKLAPEQRQAMGDSGRRFYEQEFARHVLLTRLEQLFGSATLRRTT
ncbi:hypothetical protein D3C76_1439660 [compost metagenome]